MRNVYDLIDLSSHTLHLTQKLIPAPDSLQARGLSGRRGERAAPTVNKPLPAVHRLSPSGLGLIRAIISPACFLFSTSISNNLHTSNEGTFPSSGRRYRENHRSMIWNDAPGQRGPSETKQTMSYSCLLLDSSIAALTILSTSRNVCVCIHSSPASAKVHAKPCYEPSSLTLEVSLDVRNSHDMYPVAESEAPLTVVLWVQRLS